MIEKALRKFERERLGYWTIEGWRNPEQLQLHLFTPDEYQTFRRRPDEIKRSLLQAVIGNQFDRLGTVDYVPSDEPGPSQLSLMPYFDRVPPLKLSNQWYAGCEQWGLPEPGRYKGRDFEKRVIIPYVPP